MGLSSTIIYTSELILCSTNIFICLLDHVYKAPFASTKMGHQRWPEMPLILGRSGNQYVAMVTKLLSSNCGAHLVESYCKESHIG